MSNLEAYVLLFLTYVLAEIVMHWVGKARR